MHARALQKKEKEWDWESLGSLFLSLGLGVASGVAIKFYLQPFLLQTFPSLTPIISALNKFKMEHGGPPIPVTKLLEAFTAFTGIGFYNPLPWW